MFTLCVICYNQKNPSCPERTFHRFPKNEEMNQKWIEAIQPHCSSTSGMICSDHFLPEDFCQPIGYGYVPKRLLQDNAVPKLKIVGLSMTDVRLQRDNIKEDVEQRVIVRSLDSSEKENMFCMTEDAENSAIKQPEISPFDFFTQSLDSLSYSDDYLTLSCESDYIPSKYDYENGLLQCGDTDIPLNFDYKNIPLNYSNENIPLNCGNENIPLNCGNENRPLNYDYENIPINCDNLKVSLNCGNQNIPSNDGNEFITDPDLKRIIRGNVDTIDLRQECNATLAEFNSAEQKKDDYLETKLQRVVIKMPDIGLRSFTEDDFTSSLAWKIFVKFILHNRKETRSLRHKSIRLQQKIESYQKMFNILRKGGRIRMEKKF